MRAWLLNTVQMPSHSEEGNLPANLAFCIFLLELGDNTSSGEVLIIIVDSKRISQHNNYTFRSSYFPKMYNERQEYSKCWWTGLSLYCRKIIIL